jgi:folylpolyglutamate synthase/dihydropteroate synthase
VGMGGLLDATNILNNQAISVVTKIARDHEAFLGTTLAEIAKHKAGILRPKVPYIVNPENEMHVQEVIDDYAKEIGAGPRLSLGNAQMTEKLFKTDNWRFFAGPLPPFQRDNAVMAIVATMEAVKDIGKIHWDMIGDEIGKKRFEHNPGRMQSMKVVPVFGDAEDSGRTIIVDGAHNVDAAKALSGFVQGKARWNWIGSDRAPRDGWPVTWVLAMTEGKDAKNILGCLVRPGDKVITTSFGPVDGMPWVKPMDPQALLDIALQIPNVTGFAIPERGVFRALQAAKFFALQDHPIVLAGSLYLMGDFYRELENQSQDRRFWTQDQYHDIRGEMLRLSREEEARVKSFLRGQNPDQTDHQYSTVRETDAQRKKKIMDEIEYIERKMALIIIKEKQVEQKHPVINPPSIDDVKWDDVDKTWPATDNPPPSDRPYPGKYKELRERARVLKFRLASVEQEEQGALPIRMFYSKAKDEPQESVRGPKISMHFKDDEGNDRRNFRRPDFVARKKWES